jgi:membrane protein
MGVFMLVAVAIILFGSRIAGWLAGETGLSLIATLLWEVLQWPIAVFLVMVAFAIVYRYAPNKPRPRWKWITPGAVVGVLLWLLASFGFRVYLMYFNNYSATYGSLGALIVLMMWFYVTAIAILLGGEVDSEIEASARSKAGQSADIRNADSESRAA